MSKDVAQDGPFYLCPGNGCRGAGVSRTPGTCPNCGANRDEVDGTGAPWVDKVSEPRILDRVIADLYERDAKGRHTYGSSLRASSPNDALRFAYEEALDLAMYLRQEIERRGAS